LFPGKSKIDGVIEDTESTDSDSVGGRAAKFRNRLKEKDTVTGNPRYGPKMQEKVSGLLLRFESLAGPLEQARAESSSIFEQWKQTADLEEQLERERALQQARDQEKQQQIERLRVCEQEQKKCRKAAADEDERMAEQAHIAEKAQQIRLDRQIQKEAQKAEALRLATEEEQLINHRMNHSQVGFDGFKAAINDLSTSACASGEEPAKTDALNALMAIVSNICQRPEESTFRTLKLHNPQFQDHIGKHAGGLECMASLGFSLQSRQQQEGDTVQVLFLAEPDLASDMDKWSEWYDLLKECRAFLSEITN